MNAIYGKQNIPSGIGVEPGKLLATEIKKLAKLPLMHEPGAKFTYGLNTDVLGYLIEVVSGKSFYDFLRERIFEPLGMEDTYFYLPKKKYDRLTTVTLEDSTGHIIVVKPTYHGFNVNYPNTPGTYFSGGAGLSSTAYDYAIFLQMMLNGGIYNGHRILSRNAVRMMTMSQIGDIPYGENTFGLGFGIITEKGSARLPVREGSYEWGGYWGTNYWVDPKERLVGQIMTQHEDNTHGDVFDKFKVLVYQAIND
jgi:CubicO group peptidase (beta-lactamase class C family)